MTEEDVRWGTEMTTPQASVIRETYRCGHEIVVTAPTWEAAHAELLKRRRKHACRR